MVTSDVEVEADLQYASVQGAITICSLAQSHQTLHIDSQCT